MRVREAARVLRGRVALPDRPDAWAGTITVVAGAEAKNLEVWQWRTFTRLAPESAGVDLMLTSRRSSHATQMREDPSRAGDSARAPVLAM